MKYRTMWKLVFALFFIAILSIPVTAKANDEYQVKDPTGKAWISVEDKVYDVDDTVDVKVYVTDQFSSLNALVCYDKNILDEVKEYDEILVKEDEDDQEYSKKKTMFETNGSILQKFEWRYNDFQPETYDFDDDYPEWLYKDAKYNIMWDLKEPVRLDENSVFFTMHFKVKKKFETTAIRVTGMDFVDGYEEGSQFIIDSWRYESIQTTIRGDNSESDVQKLDVPTNLSWQNNTVASWFAVQSADSYEVELCIDNGTSMVTPSETVVVTGGTSKNLNEQIAVIFNSLRSPSGVAGVKFRVRAKAAEGDALHTDSLWSDYSEDSGYRPSPAAQPLATPTELVWGNDKKTASWEAVQNAGGYDVELVAACGASRVTPSETVSVTDASVDLSNQIQTLFDSIADKSAINGIRFRVRAKKEADDILHTDSPWSDYSLDSGYRPDPSAQPLSIPTGLRWGSDKTTANWNSVAGANKYDLELTIFGENSRLIPSETLSVTGTSTNLNGQIQSIINSIADKSTISGIKFRVRAKTAEGDTSRTNSQWSDYSLDSGYRPDPAAQTLSAPTGLTWGTDKTTANWDAVTGASNYEIDLIVEYGSSCITPADTISSTGTSINLGNQVQSLLNALNTSANISAVKFRVRSKAGASDTLHTDSSWSGFSADSGYRLAPSEQESLTDCDIVFPKGDIPYTGNEITIRALSEAKKTEETNYGEFYIINRHSPYNVLSYGTDYSFSINPSQVKTLGYYTLNITGKGTYKGGVVTKFRVVDSDPLPSEPPTPTPGNLFLRTITYPETSGGGQTRLYANGLEYVMSPGYDFVVYGSDDKVVDPGEYEVRSAYTTDGKNLIGVKGDPEKTIEIPFTVETPGNPSSNYAKSSIAGKFIIIPSKSDTTDNSDKLDTPTGLSWSGVHRTQANWDAVSGAGSYYVQVKVDYGTKSKTASRVTTDTYIELKSAIDKLSDSIGDASSVNMVSFHVYAQSADTGRYADSEWSAYSSDSGYRKETGKDDEDEDDESETVIAVKGTATLEHPGFTVTKWKSTNKNVATVNSQGIVTGKKAGRAMITATGSSSSKIRQYSVIVEKPVIKDAVLSTRDSFDVSRRITGASLLDPVRYYSSDTSVIEIDDTGFATVKKGGKTKITVFYEHGSVSAVYTVKLPYIKENGISLLESKSKTLSVINKKGAYILSWRSSDDSIAEVNGKGRVTAVNPGEATIYLLVDGSIYDSCKVTVKRPEIRQQAIEVKSKKTAQLQIINKSRNVVFRSSDTTVATVNKNGKVKGLTPGKAYISLTINGVVYDTCQVTVR